MEAFIYAILFIVVCIVAVAGWLVIRHIIREQDARWLQQQATLRDRAMERRRRYSTLSYDGLGNPEVYYDRGTGRWFVPPIGNSPTPNPIYIQPGSATAPRINELKPPSKSDIVIRAWTDKVVRGEVEEDKLPPGDETPELEAPDPERKLEPKRNENGEISGFISEFHANLAMLKREGKVGKVEAIKSVTGAKPGDSAKWKYWSSYWEEIPTKE